MKHLMRMTAGILAVLAAFCLLSPLGVAAQDGETGESGGPEVAEFLPAVTTYDEVTERLRTVLSQTEGLYWNRYRGKYNGKTSAESQDMLMLAAQTGEYASVCTQTKCTGKPRHDENGCQSNLIEGCRQCQGFAKWLGYCLTGECPSGNVSTAHWERITDIGWDFTLKPGDVVHKVTSSKWGHYMVVVGLSEETPDRVILMDCNSDGGCLIASHEIPINTVVAWLRAKGGFVCRYDRFADHTHIPDENGDCVWVDCAYHCHTFDETGYCKKRGCAWDYLQTWEFARNRRTDLQGIALPVNLRDGKGAYIARTRPYGESDVAAYAVVNGTGNEPAADATEVNVTGFCYNHRGELWYELILDGRRCYAHSSVITVKWMES